MSYEFARYLNIRSANTPVFAMAGDRLAFLSDITDNVQVWSIGLNDQPDAGWPRQLTFLPDKVWELYSTPSAPHLLALSDVAGNERQQFYLITNAGSDVTGNETHDVRKLTSNDQAIHHFGSWSADGMAIFYTSNTRNNVDFDLYRLDIIDGKSTLLLETAGRWQITARSPDSTKLLCTEDISSSTVQLHLVDLMTGSTQCLTATQPPARYGAIRWTQHGIYLLTDQGHDRGALCRLDETTGALEVILDAVALKEVGELDLFTVAADGQRAALSYNADGWSVLYLIDLAQKSYRQLDRVPQGIVSKLQFNADGGQLAFDLQSPTLPQDVWLLDCATATCRQLTFSSRAGIDTTTLITPTVVNYPSFDGEQIPAFYYQPQTAPPAGGYPAILYVHGGPASQLRPEFDVRFHYFLGQGYAILATNVRGSTGYGRRYMLLDEVELRMDSVVDLKYAVQWLYEQREIDGDRIAIYGRSYGGYMVLAALTEYPELFAAGVDVVGIANWVTFLERTSPWRRAHREEEYGSLANHRDLLEQLSPIHKVDQIKAPLMVMAGDNDPRVPLFESEQVVERVRNAGGTVEFIHYADEGHKFSKLANRIDSFTKMGEFLQRYV